MKFRKLALTGVLALTAALATTCAANNGAPPAARAHVTHAVLTSASPVWLVKGQDMRPWCFQSSVAGGGQLATCTAGPAQGQYQSVGLEAWASAQGQTLPPVNFQLCGTYGGKTYGKSDYTPCSPSPNATLVFENYNKFVSAVQNGVFTATGMKYAIYDLESWGTSNWSGTQWQNPDYYIGKAISYASNHGIHIIITVGGKIASCWSCMTYAAKHHAYMVTVQSQGRTTLSSWKTMVSSARSAVRAGSYTTILMAGLATNTPIVHPVKQLQSYYTAGQGMGISHYWLNADNHGPTNQCTLDEGKYGCPQIGVDFLGAP